MHRVLVSACLLGDRVRHNGAHKKSDHDILQRWIAEGRVVAVCPEVAGGLPVPRPPAEIRDGVVFDVNGRDVSAEFTAGAQQALAMAQAHAIRVAVLKEGSPSCGVHFIYDGTFTSTRVDGSGVTAALLRSEGIAVFNEAEFEAADLYLRREDDRDR